MPTCVRDHAGLSFLLACVAAFPLVRLGADLHHQKLEASSLSRASSPEWLAMTPSRRASRVHRLPAYKHPTPPLIDLLYSSRGQPLPETHLQPRLVFLDLFPHVTEMPCLFRPPPSPHCCCCPLLLSLERARSIASLLLPNRGLVMLRFETEDHQDRQDPDSEAKYYYKPEEFGCIKSPRRPIFRQVRLPVSSSTTTAGDLGHAKYPFELSIPQAPSSTTTQVPRERLYLYHRRGSDKYPYNKCTSTIVFGIAKNVKHPFEMTRPTSLNDPKYLSKNETYTATVARIETDKSEDASTTLNHVRRPSPKTRVMQMSSSTTVA
ncbi:hypothetical protein VPH35_044112 [Triticum aestivum]|uniref:uncharacterized protein n=1 Tax=Triticum aestivum TaxID=4565 RepID=UPI001D0076DF|nr:uncharacterized protein LOC123058256 [Triticum aestivum]